MMVPQLQDLVRDKERTWWLFELLSAADKRWLN
jgi:hypothetical protein